MLSEGVLVGWSVFEAGGLSIVAAGLGGKSGTYMNLLSADSLELALTFGIPVTIGLLAGPFGDQSFWQRAFATERRHVKSAFIWGAVIFAMVPLVMSQLGFIAAGSGLDVHDPATVNLENCPGILAILDYHSICFCSSIRACVHFGFKSLRHIIISRS